MMDANEFNKAVEEFEKCKASPYYFYANYWTVNGKKPVIKLSEEQFNKIFSQWNQQHGSK
jgi:hypothetical protein